MYIYIWGHVSISILYIQILWILSCYKEYIYKCIYIMYHTLYHATYDTYGMLNLFGPLFPESWASYLHQSKLGRLCCKANLAAKSMCILTLLTSEWRQFQMVPKISKSTFEAHFAIPPLHGALCEVSKNENHGTFGLSSFTNSRWARINASPTDSTSCFMM